MALSPLDSTALLHNLQTGVVVHAVNTEIIYANPQALKLLNLSEAQACGVTAFDDQWHFIDKFNRAIPPEQFPVNRVIRTKKTQSGIEIGICDSATKEVTWVLCNAYPELTSNNEISQVIVTFLDITQQKKDISFEDIVGLANDIIIVTEAMTSPDSEETIVYVNEAFTALTGYTKEEVIGKTPRILQGDETSVNTKREIRQSLDQHLAIRAQLINYSKSGKKYWLDMNIFPLKNNVGEVTHFAAIERDITTQKNNEDALKEQSIRDSLTTLFNRRGFFEVANSHIIQSKRKRSPLTVVMIDIDHFKKINDQYGHDTGDKALQHLSLLMNAYFRKSDIIGRVGGEEFAVLMPDSDIDAAVKRTQEFLVYLSKHPLYIDTHGTIAFTISAGVTELNESIQDASNILIEADLELYQAKHAGRNRVSYSKKSLNN
ncbi:sensor domain-containing diguanylate cyclase [Alkalimarinus alittae]|uniref:Diguanylate cyclase n=1 Tax=Alkalimarinus alittae TaxID=2961619 RepID=A0ABY6N481_9ALTE|nr:diguanylate cyclase [Alkalimarinus alittae]UZE96797.1 diguanylate cyclase [Alkalimarinus alittae]